MATTTKTQHVIASLHTSLGGDARYTDALAVVYDSADDTVAVRVVSTVPAGGMDGSSTVALSDPTFERVLKPKCTGPEVLKAIKEAIKSPGLNFARYGKPTKNFEWYGVGMGLSNKLAIAALALARNSR